MADNAPEAHRYAADRLRQGTIVFRQRWKRAAFICGLGALVLIPLIVTWLLVAAHEAR